MSGSGAPFQAVRWTGAGDDGVLVLVDQTRLPGAYVELRLTDPEEVREAIVRLAVRGAPAIGVAAAFGLWLAIRNAPGEAPAFDAALARAHARLKAARPTAVNLAWALDKVAAAARRGADVPSRKAAAFAEASEIHAHDVAVCERLGAHGATLLGPGARVLTYCNTGALAAAGCGTALAAVFEAHRKGARPSVIACETRPLLQGARLTMWELMRAGIDATLICDNTAAVVMAKKLVDVVLVGADRIARNGDTANKIGTYGVALLAKAHGIPFYVVAPRSTFDWGLASGDHIPIEERAGAEITRIGGAAIAPEGAAVYAPAFDVTNASLIAGIVTEAGIIAPVTATEVARIREV
jgi:methylthioribose-1-phosphate isomerase